MDSRDVETARELVLVDPPGPVVKAIDQQTANPLIYAGVSKRTLADADHCSCLLMTRSYPERLAQLVRLLKVVCWGEIYGLDSLSTA
jgi:hypothetical protein